MKATITGLTSSTITFNALNIVVHGKEIARHIDIISQDAEAEVYGLERAGLISVVDESIDLITDKIVTDSTTKSTTKKVKEVKTNDDELKVTEITPKETSSKDLIAKSESKKGRGRPKGAKNKRNKMKSKGLDDVVVATGDGKYAKTRTIKESDKEGAASDITKPSIEAMKKLKAEEYLASLQDIGFDEENLDVTQKMGQKAIIGTGDGTLKVPMKHSAIPGAEEIAQRNPFIDGDDNLDDSDSAFVDKDDDVGDLLEV